MTPVDVRADALQDRHLPMINGEVVELVDVTDLRVMPQPADTIELTYVPYDAPATAPMHVAEHDPGDLVPCIRRVDRPPRAEEVDPWSRP